MRKRDFLKGTVSVAALAALTTPLFAQRVAKAPPPKRMNLLFITADDMDGSIPGFMSGRTGITPNLDALAARSHRVSASAPMHCFHMLRAWDGSTLSALPK